MPRKTITTLAVAVDAGLSDARRVGRRSGSEDDEAEDEVVTTVDGHRPVRPVQPLGPPDHPDQGRRRRPPRRHSRRSRSRSSRSTTRSTRSHTFRSVYINDQALPLLIEEALEAQSPNVETISGATDVTVSFKQSLQAAILRPRRSSQRPWRRCPASGASRDHGHADRRRRARRRGRRRSCSTARSTGSARSTRVFSTYKDDSEISRLNRDELALRECREDVRWVIARCRELRDETDGYFDAEAVVPGTIDPSGLVKGWSVDRAAAAARRGGRCELRRQRRRRHPPARRRAARAALARRHPAPADPRQDRGRRRGERPRGRDLGRVLRGEHVVDPHTGRPPRGAALGDDHRPRPRDGRRVRDRRVRDGRGRAGVDAPARALRGDDDHRRRPRAVDAGFPAPATPPPPT